MAKTNTEKLGGIDAKMAQLAAQRKRIIQQENQRLRKERTSRLADYMRWIKHYGKLFRRHSRKPNP